MLSAAMDPIQAAVTRAMELSDGEIGDEHEFFHLVFSVLLDMHATLGLKPPSPDDTWRDLRVWAAKRSAA